MDEQQDPYDEEFQALPGPAAGHQGEKTEHKEDAAENDEEHHSVAACHVLDPRRPPVEGEGRNNCEQWHQDRHYQ